MNIEDVEGILGSCHLLAMLAPDHVFITDEQVRQVHGSMTYRGLAPKKKRGVIFLSGAANFSTVPHEVMHSAIGMGEVGAYPLGFIMGLRAQLGQTLGLVKPGGDRRPSYKEVDPPKGYGGRVKHYVKVG
ncbi:MAG: hypothetical protein PHI12_08050 [Dehalococcoidales bacterium]|jgi:hypothetical protein|nr:hypothetical protein [Dehalococcoidales bacterium]